ncbi:hypothetical protein SAMN04488691_11039 [Haloferax larsenii]|uniref:Uncharacterized protein n=2 Tax=Haloferax larsenii TaxID=302484 RepID=A0A1H7TTE0_HALLR|nr:hypothetical protein SAMN04488691_11039 [Haloferax larsenii]
MSDQHLGSSDKKENKPKINRRKLLGAVGSGFALGPSFVQTVTAEQTNIREVLKKDSVNEVLDYVGFKSKDKRSGDHRTTLIGESDKTQIKGIDIEFPIGTLEYSEVISSSTDRLEVGESEAAFKISNFTEEKKEKLPGDFDSVPLGVTIRVSYEDTASDQIIVTTTTTDQEDEQLKEVIGEEEITAVYVDGDDDYYRVTDPNGNTYQVTGNIDRPDIQQATAKPQVQIQVYDSHYCYGCAGEQGHCPQCVVSCVPEVGSIAGCVQCIASKCNDINFGACAKCLAWAASVGIV